jgi:hypothetical protein
MSQTGQNLLRQFMAMSRPLQVGVIGIGMIVLYVVIHDYIWTLADDWNDQSNRISSVIGESRRHLKELSGDAQKLVAVYGPVEPPSSESAGSQQLAKAVNDIIKAQGSKVINFSYKAQDGAKLPREALKGMEEVPGQRFDRLRAEVKFDGTTEVVAAVLSELESHPEIEAIGSLRIVRHDQPPKVTVNLTVEAWVKAAAVERRSGGGGA